MASTVSRVNDGRGVKEAGFKPGVEGKVIRGHDRGLGSPPQLGHQVKRRQPGT